MDWSAIYEETGDEAGDWTGFASRLTPILENFSSRGQYTSTVCYIFTINYILGVGCLGIPYAFLKCGIVLSSVLIVTLSTVAYMTVMWVAESGHRDLEIRLLEDQMTPTKRNMSDGRGWRRPRGRTWSINTNNPHSNFTTPTKDSSEEQHLKSPTEKDFSRSGGRSNSGYGTVAIPSNRSTPEEDAGVEFSSLSSLIKQESRRRMTISPTNMSCSPQSAKQFRFRLPSEEFAFQDVLEGDGEAEVVELVLRFLGPTAKSCYQISVMLLMYIGLIAYTQVFVHTFQQQVWFGVSPYIPSIAFACVVLPLSCIDLAEQINIQVTMSILRFVSLGTLVLGTFVAICIDSRDSGYEDVPPESDHVPLYNLTGFSLMFTTAIFSQLFQHSVPGLIRPLPADEKRKVPRIFLGALCTTGFFYLVIGISCVYYFGPKVNQAINLNFVSFDWGLQEFSIIILGVIRLMSMVVVLFPALDTVSVYPLIANTLGNNLNVSFPMTYKTVQNFIRDYTSYCLSKCEAKKASTVFWRLLAAFPPIIGSLLITDLSLTLQFAGLCGILVALVTPALLQYYSKQELEETKQLCLTENNESFQVESISDINVNPYKGIFSSRSYTYFVLFLALFALIICSVQIYSVA